MNYNSMKKTVKLQESCLSEIVNFQKYFNFVQSLIFNFNNKRNIENLLQEELIKD